jgi:ribose transport system substrate-binding protein
MNWARSVVCALLIVASVMEWSGGAALRAETAKTVAFVAAVANNPYFDYMVCGAKHAAKDHHGKLIAQAPSKFDPVEQTQILDALMARRPDAFVIDAIDVNAMTPPIKNIINQRIPVVTAEEEIQVPGQVTNIVSDQVLAGRLGAQTLLRAMGKDRGKVFVMDFQPGVASTDERRQGFEAEIKHHAGITYLGPQYARADSSKAAQLTLAILQREPDLAGVFSTNLYGAQGVINALKQAGKQSQVPIVTMDILPNEVPWVQKGDVYALIAQKPFQVGRQSTDIAFKYLEGQRGFPAKQYVTNPFTVVTRLNVNAPEVQKLVPTSQCDI